MPDDWEEVQLKIFAVKVLSIMLIYFQHAVADDVDGVCIVSFFV